MKLIEDYSNFLSTLKVVSRDKNSQISLIEDDTKEHRLINFDGVKKKLCKDYRGDALSSCDGYLNKNGVRYLIEFKNQAEGNVDKTIIKNKAYELDQYPQKFDTKRYINQFYKNVYTIDIKVFKKKFMDILFSSKVPV